ncbi:hypothetical protein, partial [uncultured Dubosiella sp.]|uniref:hypothetical protein n=1 Tax=uncultured Dubosiella sp. TaxID=1937011 RepID=UPI002593FA03
RVQSLQYFYPFCLSSFFYKKDSLTQKIYVLPLQNKIVPKANRRAASQTINEIRSFLPPNFNQMASWNPLSGI